MVKRILIAEDNYVLSFVYEKMAKRMGLEVVSTSRTGEEALEDILNEKPDLILMDIILQGELNGIKVIEKVRENYDAPVIFLTAQSGENVYKRIKKIENSSLVVKPVPFHELEKEVRNFLG